MLNTSNLLIEMYLIKNVDDLNINLFLNESLLLLHENLNEFSCGNLH